MLDQLELAVLRALREWSAAARSECPNGGIEALATDLATLDETKRDGRDREFFALLQKIIPQYRDGVTTRAFARSGDSDVYEVRKHHAMLAHVKKELALIGRKARMKDAHPFWFDIGSLLADVRPLAGESQRSYAEACEDVSRNTGMDAVDCARTGDWASAIANLESAVTIEQQHGGEAMFFPPVLELARQLAARVG